MEYQNEEWRPVVGYEGLYEVSDMGRVRSLNYNKTGKIRLLSICHNRKSAYDIVTLFKNGKRCYEQISRIVASAFVPNPNNYPEVNHRDENTHNDCASNLEWCPSSYNINYGTRNKRVSEKLKNYYKWAKKTLQFDTEGNFIRDWVSMAEIERVLGYDPSAIARACRGEQKTSYGFIWRFA